MTANKAPSSGATRLGSLPAPSLGRDLLVQIEYLVLAFDDENKTACLSLRQAEILDALAADEKLRREAAGPQE